MSGYRFEDAPEMAALIQRLAREEAKYRLLRDIQADIAVCRLEGWDYRAYLLELKEMLDDFLKGGEQNAAFDKTGICGGIHSLGI